MAQELSIYRVSVKCVSMRSCLVIGADLFDKIAALLEPDYHCRMYPRHSLHAESIYEHFDFSCLIVHLTNNNFQRVKYIIERMQRIRSFPIIAIIQGLDLEIARLCGKIGIDRFVERYQLFDLKSVVSDSEMRSKVQVTLADLAITDVNHPPLVSKALKYIEENYIPLVAVSEIARAVGVAEGTLSRLFKQHVLTGPKRLLMQFKLTHAINLMKIETLSLTRVAEYSGFSCEKRMNDCFNKYFRQSVKSYREQFLLKQEPANNVFYF